MTIQSDMDQEEETKAKFNEEVIGILYSDFVADGHAALPKLKYTSPDSTRAGEDVILSALRQLVSVWRGLIDQKTTLERTVTKLSAAASNQLQNPVSSTTSDVEIVELPFDGLQLQPADSCHSEDLQEDDSHDFFPPRLDSFGLETILEEERNDEDSKTGSDDVDFVHRSKTSSVEVPPKAEQISSFTQTESNAEMDMEILRAEILKTLEEAYMEKERIWNNMVCA